MKQRENPRSPRVLTDDNSVDTKLKLVDRLVNWETSVTSRDEFRALLKSGKQLRIKFGADITAQTLHIGHAVNLRAMRHLQDLGHKVVFLLGGFTTLVGDPTDKLEVRKAPDASQMEENKRQFIEQIKSTIRFDDPNLIEVRDNTEWWGTPNKAGKVRLGHFFELIKSVTVTQLLSRDMFRERMANETPIYLSEFLYPILQGYDSVAIKSDITIVGSDQLFNERMAWNFQEAAGQRRQAILCTKITPGIDGGPKQSKSIGNYVGLSFTPSEKFNKVMLLLDELIPQWFEVYTEISHEQLAKYREEYESNPLGFKKRLAFYITELFHGAEAAQTAQEEFETKKFLKRIPAETKTTPLGEAKNLDELLRTNFGRKRNDIEQFIRNGALSHITTIREDGTYDEQLFKDLDDVRSFELKGGETIRIGKNNFYKIQN